MPTKHHFLVFCWLLMSWMGIGMAIAQPVHRPNILWITCEDMSPHLPAYGDSTIITPNLSRLAREGIRYTRAFTTAGVCSSSRSALITGMYQMSIGTQHHRTTINQSVYKDIPNYDAVPPPYVKCFTEYLRANNYYCTNNSKTDYNFGNPITAWDENGPKAHWRNRWGKNQPNAARPFFSVFNLMITHQSQVWERANQPLRVNPARVKVPPYYPGNTIIRRDIARNYDNIMVMDSLVGGILDQLEADGLSDNTIVFFFSDHGAGLPWAKQEVYDRGLQMPLLIRFPNRRSGPRLAGTVNTDLISLVDFAPTVLTLTETLIPAHLQGQPFLGSTRLKPRQYVFAGRDRLGESYDLVRAVRDKRFKYLRNSQPQKPYHLPNAYREKMAMMREILRLRAVDSLPALTRRWFDTKPTEELFDTQADPLELRNLAADPAYRETLSELRRVETSWVRDIRDLGFMPERELYKSMWPGRQQPVTATPEMHRIRSPNGLSRVALTCATEGASMTYRRGSDGHWQLYHQPIDVQTGTTITVAAVRYGYATSPEVTLQ